MAEEINGGTSMDSTESRWVIQDEDEDASDLENFDADLRFRRHAGVVDSEDEDDNAEQRLIRTGPRIDSFDVEALEVPGAHRSDYEVSFLSLFENQFVEVATPRCFSV